MGDFAFKVIIAAVVRARAVTASAAREVVPTVLGAPSSAEIELANKNNVLAMGKDATVTGVEFSVGSVKACEPS